MREVSQPLTDLLSPVLREARATWTPLPLVPELGLYLLNEDYPQQTLTPEEIRQIMHYPAYWCFCWASGQVLARFIFDHPEWVRGKRVLDFGCGSGVVAIAAALNGAERVVACDLDADALAATRINARANGVELDYADDFFQFNGELDLLIVADVLYDKANLPLLDAFVQRAPEVLVADSRVKDFSFPGYAEIGRQRATTIPDLAESDEFSRVRIYRGQRALDRASGGG